jgi:hypothetical protein
MTHHPNWFTGLVLSTVIGAFCFLSDQDYRDEFAESDNLQAIQQEESAKASREFAGQAVCGPAALAQWEGDELTCHPRRGRAFVVARSEK